MKRTKCRMQVDKGKQGRNTRAVNYTHTLDTDIRKGRGDRICRGNLQGFRIQKGGATAGPGKDNTVKRSESTHRVP